MPSQYASGIKPLLGRPTSVPLVTSRPAALLLDVFGAAAAAYSLRQLSRAYAGPIVRVRSTGYGSPEADFTADSIRDGALASFVGGGNDGYATVWYDQSGNGRHATQTTAAAQPKIVSNGIVLRDVDGKPRLEFTGSQSLVGSTLSIVFNFTVLRYADQGESVVFNAVSTREGSSAGYSTDNQANAFFIRSFGSTGIVNIGIGDPISTVKNLLASRHVDGNFAVWINRGLEYSATNTIGYVSESAQALSIGAKTGFSGGDNFSGDMLEAIYYSADQTADRIAISDNIMGYYNL